jgi:putative ABC transport system substrate-binding protein
MRYRLVSISANREYVEAGALMSYGQDFQQNVRHAAIYVDRIVRGAKAADLPVELPTKLQLTLNRKTADTLGLVIPQELLISADEIIQQ